MKKKKTTLLIVIVFVLIMIVIVGGLLFYILSNSKSDKQQFVSSLMQFMSQEEETNLLNAYFTKKQNTPNTNDGTFNAIIPTEEIAQMEENLKIPTIKFSGKSNPEQKQVEQNIEIQYSNDVKLPINYRKDGETIGLQTEYVSEKYVAVENNNLQELADKLGIEVQDGQDKIEFPKKNQEQLFTEEEKNQLKEKYKTILNIITDDKISVEKAEKGKSYTLILNAQDVQSMVTQFLEILKQDDIILSKIEEIDSDISEDIESIINNLLENSKEMENIEGDIKILLTLEENEPKKIQISFSDISLTIQKHTENNSIVYEVSIAKADDINCVFKVEFTGLETQEKVTEHYALKFSSKESGAYQYDFTNTVKFVDSIEIQNLTDDTAMILNNYPKEQVTYLTQAILERLAQVNQDQMNQLGVENNPLIYTFAPVISAVFSGAVYNTANDAITQQMEQNENIGRTNITEDNNNNDDSMQEFNIDSEIMQDNE